MSNPTPERNMTRLYTLSAWLLRAGNAVSIVLLVLGIALLLWRSDHALHSSRSLLSAWRSVMRGEPAGFMEAGLQMVVLSPMILSLAICLYALVHKQRSLLISSLLVVGGLALGLWIGIAW
ncbi:MAG: DUF1634 domain-containing protein [bacterium]|nr:DUF1634 domain-containing protein [bacterium]